MVINKLRFINTLDIATRIKNYAYDEIIDVIVMR